MSTQHYLSPLVSVFGGDHGFTITYQMLHPMFNPPMTTFHHKLVTREGRVSANGWTHPSSSCVTVFVHLFIQKWHPRSYRGGTKYHIAWWQEKVGFRPMDEDIHHHPPPWPSLFTYSYKKIGIREVTAVALNITLHLALLRSHVPSVRGHWKIKCFHLDPRYSPAPTRNPHA